MGIWICRKCFKEGKHGGATTVEVIPWWWKWELYKKGEELPVCDVCRQEKASYIGENVLS